MDKKLRKRLNGAIVSLKMEGCDTTALDVKECMDALEQRDKQLAELRHWMDAQAKGMTHGQEATQAN